MPIYVALLRAVNVGGTGKLPMAKLVEICRDAGFERPRTHIASGNAIFASDAGESQARAALEARLAAYAGKLVGVAVRTGAEMAEIAGLNPFPEEPAARVLALFTPETLPEDPLAGAAGLADEQIHIGAREIYIHYPSGQGRSRLRLPAMRLATARNLNTVATLAAIARAF
jgi:uncharacterized protein (DUF1697 family)